MNSAPGLLCVGDVAVFAQDVSLREAGVKISGRRVAGEIIYPGRLCMLVNGVLMHATSPLDAVAGISLAIQYVDSYDVGDIVPLLRQGQVFVDGTVGADLDPARVLDGGTFTATGGTVVPHAVSRGSLVSGGGSVVEVNLR